MATATERDYETEDQAQPSNGSTGLITRPQASLPPASLAEQQRAITEIQASLTIAKQSPRDEKEAMDRILTTCQRLRVAEDHAFEYSRGGTAITGATIKLMEVIAQHWGNIEFGFRELARYLGTAGRAGESVVEAFAWDLQTNTRRRVQFTVEHAMVAYGKKKVLTDPRDIYEYIANNAQRRVRTCLENIIPRDIVDVAMEECAKTLKEQAPVTPDGLKKLCEAFGKFGVTKEQIEARIQRRLDSMTSAQYAAMRRIYKSLDEGMSQPGEWFKDAAGESVADAKPKSATQAAKDALRKSQEKAQQPAHELPPETREPGDDTDPIESELRGAIAHVKTLPDKISVNKFEAEAAAHLAELGVSEEGLKEFHAACDWRRKEIGGSRGGKQGNLMETAPMA